MHNTERAVSDSACKDQKVDKRKHNILCKQDLFVQNDSLKLKADVNIYLQKDKVETSYLKT